MFNEDSAVRERRKESFTQLMYRHLGPKQAAAKCTGRVQKTSLAGSDHSNIRNAREVLIHAQLLAHDCQVPNASSGMHAREYKCADSASANTCLLVTCRGGS